MSKTDKTTPYWVRQFFDAPVDHDHRSGVCRTETFADAQHVAHNGRKHRCARIERVPAACPGPDGCRRAFTRRALLCDQALTARNWRLYFRYSNSTTLPCEQPHHTTVMHADWPCAGCDWRETAPTCEHSLWSHARRGADLSRYDARSRAESQIRRLENRADRGRARAALRSSLREWNDDGQVETEVPLPRRSDGWWL